MKIFKNIIVVALILFIFLFPAILKNLDRNYNYLNNNTANIIQQSDIYHENIVEDIKTSSFLFFGDIMTGRNVEMLSQENNDYPFLNLKDLLSEKNNIRFANLEGPIDKNHIRTKTGSVSFSLPEYTVNVLKNNGFNLLQLANNHMQDRGSYGFLNTMDVLKNNRIDFFGDYYNRDEYSSFEKNINGINYIFIGVNIINTDCEKDSDICINNIDDEIKNIINNKNDYFKILFIHWGNEYKLKSNNIQKTLAHKLIDSGVDLIIGGHPHVTQEIEKYNNKMIFYSLGNFIFDQYFSKDTQQSYSIRLTVTSTDSKINKLEFDIIPLISVKSQPEIMDENNENIFLQTLSENSNDNMKEEIKNKRIIIQ